MGKYDEFDRKLLTELQIDASRSIEEMADAIGLSRNAAWRRIKRLEAEGVIASRVALVDPAAVGLGLEAFVSIRTDRHDAAWAAEFAAAVKLFPEIVGVYRTAGAQDYLIRARVADVAAYDDLYQRLIARIELKDVSASFVMEEVKETTRLPVNRLA